MAGIPLVLSGAADDEKRPDMAKLLDPLTQQEEICRIVGAVPKVKAGEEQLTAFRLHWCPQLDGSAPLLLLATSTDPVFSFDLDRAYQLDEPETLFGPESRLLIPGPSSPSPNPCFLTSLRLYSQEGGLIQPFSEDAYLSEGFLLDFDGDGVLDRAQVSQSGLSQKDQISVLEITTIERNSRTLAKVVYDWKVEGALRDEDWKVTCRIKKGGRLPELCFGPKNASAAGDLERVVLAWNEGRKEFQLNESPDAGSARMVRLLKAGETPQSVAKAKLLERQTERGSEQESNQTIEQGPYVFQSLKDRSDKDLLAFFDCSSGEQEPFFIGGSSPTRQPQNFWNLSAKEAALRLVDENRKDSHRLRWKLAIDDRGGILPPTSGWLTWSWHSSGCYSSSAMDFAIRFGAGKPLLLVTEYNSIGVVGADPLVDRPAYRVQLLELTPEEARFLVDTVFWLNRVRSSDSGQSDCSFGGIHSTADGHASLVIHEDGKEPSELGSDTVYAGGYIAGRWKEGYGKEQFVNFASWFLKEAVPEHLKNRWDQTLSTGRQSLATPLEERVKERTSQEQRIGLSETIGKVFALNRSTPVPASVLRKVIFATGEERLKGLSEPITELLASIPAKTAEEKELEHLERKLERDHFGEPMDAESANNEKLQKRRDFLRGKHEFDRSHLLRASLLRASEQLGLVEDAGKLMKVALGKQDLSNWALHTLQKEYPEIYCDVLEAKFRHEDLDGKRSIFSTLSILAPKRAEGFASRLTPQQEKDLLIELADHDLRNKGQKAARRVDLLLKLVGNRKEEMSKRSTAISLLSDFSKTEAQLTRFEALLLSELKDPQTSSYGSSSIPETVTAISKLPTAANHLGVLEKVRDDGWNSFDAGLNAIARAGEGSADTREYLHRYIAPRLTNHNGMMNDVFLAILAFDLRSLQSEVQSFSTEGSQVKDGAAATYSGGSFKGPVGHKYHAARKVTAIWEEPDALTRARMWVALALCHFSPSAIKGESPTDKALISGFRAAVAQVPKEQLVSTMEPLLKSGATNCDDKVLDWLRNELRGK